MKKRHAGLPDRDRSVRKPLRSRSYTPSGSPRIGLALGGGGARGLAHIPVLEAFDDLGIKPAAIAGSSIGGIMAVGYASGLSGDDIRTYTTDLLGNRSEVLSRLWKLRGKGFAGLLEGVGLARVDAERIVDLFLPPEIPKDFADLTIPVTLVAADFYGWCEADLQTGPLRRAIAASMALPGLFKPVTLGEQVMMDGGLVNPLPFDKLPEDVDIVLAVDVLGGPAPRRGRKLPSASESVFGATQLLMKTIQREKLRRRRPDILIRPEVTNYRVLDFLKAGEILKVNSGVRETAKRQLEATLEDWSAGRLSAPEAGEETKEKEAPVAGE